MTDYAKLKVVELRDLLKERGISSAGLSKKQQIIDALQADDADAGLGSDAEDPDSNVVNPPTKRSASPVDGAPAKKAKSSNAKLNIPVDEGCPLAGYRVHIGPIDGIIWDASLNQTSASNNNNKFYRVQLLEGPKGDYKTWTRWGRVGEHGQKAVLGNGSLEDAHKHFDKKFKDKSGLKWAERGNDPKPGKYVFVERSYAPDSDDEEEEKPRKNSVSKSSDYVPPESKLEKPVQSLMELIFNQQYFAAAMSSLNYDANKLPLGKLSKTTISRGFQALKNVAAAMEDPAQANQIEQLSNLYYSLVPHDFGRNRPPCINNSVLLKKEIELLESLSDLKDADNIIKKDKEGVEEVHPLDSRFGSLGMQEMTPLSTGSDEFSAISEYLHKTCGETHYVKYEIQDIFRIERQGELDRFQKSAFSSIESDRRLLWHGSRATNFGGILGQGLRIAPPEAPATGYMFDKGIYLADMSSKSAGYCCSGISDGHALLLLCEAELGKPMLELTQAKYNAATEAKNSGHYATWGKGRMGPLGWKDAKCVHPSLAGVMMPDTTQAPGSTGIDDCGLYYNEYICYDVAQIRLRYLLRVKM
ncbi:uncharacterized protein K452DRAFT_322316 [Aplosporella prunicola CBS 121167]|uniref:Poly [ADP-ribose] polymerase n=1 Tax=Aplosporella prunicola CBS 121167 TaxID=1176127 RepID=A0A6A6B058_9PEZI|nr:uncharacterized protein K452DRAFT_322316 [Aplosporella prunicola CBS 121167]KAF2136605.1 hypothetical protein K452DRAFT_322316 [Aplosporella prunicola CBS 121167]